MDVARAFRIASCSSSRTMRLRYERADVVWPNRPEQRGRLAVDQDDDLVAVLRPFEVLAEPGT